jgi:hypothetical protein
LHLDVGPLFTEQNTQQSWLERAQQKNAERRQIAPTTTRRLCPIT